MAWQRGKDKGDPWSIAEQPASKRRKVGTGEKEERQRSSPADEPNKDDWDDSVEFTQAELETLDVMASQAMNQSEAQRPTTSTAEPQSDTSFAIPTVHRTTNRSSLSSSDSSHHPHSLSTRSSINTSGSLSSHSSTNGKVDPSKEMLQTLQDKLDEQIKKAQEEKYRYEGEVRYLRESLHKQEEELERMRGERDDRFEQQKQAQADKLQKLQTKLDSLSSEAEFKKKDFQDLQEQNLTLQQKLRRLEHLQEQSGKKTDIQIPASPKRASPRKILVQPSPPSKQHQLQKQREAETGSQTQGFPTQLTFMERTVSPSTSSLKSTGISTSCQTTEMVRATKPAQCRRLHLSIEPSSGQLSGPQIVRHLLQTVEPSVEPKELSEKVQWDPGLAALLHAKSTSLRIAGLTYRRSKDSPFLSPARPKRQRQLLKSPGDLAGDETIQVVSREHFQQAVEGLSMMLEAVDEVKDKSGDFTSGEQDLHKRIGTTLVEMRQSLVKSQMVIGHSPSLPACKAGPSKGITSNYQNGGPKTEDLQHSTTVMQVPISSKDSHPQDHRLHAGAVMLLPLLTDYIHHYVDLIHSPAGTTQPSIYSPSSLDSSRSFADSSSYESSLESLSSHIAQLLNEGKIYASSVEAHGMSALRCLALLIHLCPPVGHAVIDSHLGTCVPSVATVSTGTMSSSSTAETVPEPFIKNKMSSGAEADDEHSTSSSEIRVITGVHDQSVSYYGQRETSKVYSSLLHLVMRLAGQDLEESQSDSEAVKLALKVLTNISHCCPQDQIHKLEVFITRGILTNCLKQTTHPSVMFWAQRLLFALAKCEKLLTRLCAKSENCPLYLIHRAFSTKSQDMVQVYSEYIVNLSAVVSQHRSGLCLLLSNACPCSEELVVAVIMALHKLLSVYKWKKPCGKQSLLSTLAQGTVLIYTLAQGDAAFRQRVSAVQLQYIRLLSGLVAVLRPRHEEWEFHVSALEELCDFEPGIADTDTSQESESEDRMEQS